MKKKKLAEEEPKVEMPLNTRRWKIVLDKKKPWEYDYIGVHDFKGLGSQKCPTCGFTQKHLIHNIALLEEEERKEAENIAKLFSMGRWEIYIKQGLDLYAKFNDREALVTVAMKTMNKWIFDETH